MSMRKWLAFTGIPLAALVLWLLLRRGKGGEKMRSLLEGLGRERFLAVVILLLLGLFFRFGLTGHRFLAYTLWAIALLVLWFYAMELLKPSCPRLEKVLHTVTVYGLVIFLMVFAATEMVLLSSSKTAEDPEAEYLVVLGAGVNGTVPSWSLRDRLEVAYTYLVTYPDSVAILSGAQGPHEDITEAECMARWLTEKGIAPQRLIKEEEAERTINNLENSFRIIEEREGSQKVRIAVLSSEYHLLRAKLLSQRLGVTVLPVAAPTGSFTLKVNHYIRECFGLWYYLIFDR